MVLFKECVRVFTDIIVKKLLKPVMTYCQNPLIGHRSELLLWLTLNHYIILAKDKAFENIKPRSTSIPVSFTFKSVAETSSIVTWIQTTVRKQTKQGLTRKLEFFINYNKVTKKYSFKLTITILVYNSIQK